MFRIREERRILIIILTLLLVIFFDINFSGEKVETKKDSITESDKQNLESEILIKTEKPKTEIEAKIDSKKNKKEENKKEEKQKTKILPVPTLETTTKIFVPNNKYEYGVWLWQSPLDLREDYKNTIDKIDKANFNTIYISIDDFATIEKKQEYFQALSNFISDAKKKNIKVDTVVGAPAWALKNNHQQALRVVDFVLEYNAKFTESKINKLQFDIEPYLLPIYEANKKTVLWDFINLIDISAQKISEKGNVGFSVVLPHFYDKNQKWTPLINYQGENNFTFDHIVKILNKIDNSSIIIMSYRNFVEGKNGVDAISRTEIDAKTKNTKIIIAQETGESYPEYTTFFGKTKDDLYTQLNKINSLYDTFPSFGGIAIHYLKTFLKL